ncbi:hypothetical protein NXV40_15315 [Bacteroides fragilis]|nr:hypothetical protein [Bacteroides fragilis]
MQKIGADWCRLVQKCTAIPIAVLRTLYRGETEPCFHPFRPSVAVIQSLQITNTDTNMLSDL